MEKIERNKQLKKLLLIPLDEISLAGARGVLINVTGGNDMTLFELDEAANRIRDEIDGDAKILVGTTLDPVLDGTIQSFCCCHRDRSRKSNS